MRYVAEGSLERRWRRAVRRDADPARLTRALSALGAVEGIHVRPGAIEATVRSSRTVAYQVGLGVDILGPQWRERWLRARAEAAQPDGGSEGEGSARALDPMPAPGAVHPRCTCPDIAPAGWCKHACAVAEAIALALEADGPDLLWRARGLVSEGPGIVPTPAPGQGEGGDREASDAQAFWGFDPGDVEGQEWQAWVDVPSALARLGPLPTARGQQAAADPILAHYRRVRDAVRPWFGGEGEGAEAARRGRAARERGADAGWNAIPDGVPGGKRSTRANRLADDAGWPDVSASPRKDSAEESGGR